MGAPVRIDTNLISKTRGADGRRALRRFIRTSALLRPLGHHARAAVVRNLSTTGFMAESEQSFTPGETARLQLPEIGFVSARVVWTDHGRIGAEFDQPIAPGAFARIIDMCAA